MQSYQTIEHPLKLVTVVDSKGTRAPGSNVSSRSSSMMSILSEPLTQSFDGTDPLSQFAKQDQESIDPLTQQMVASEYVTMNAMFLFMCIQIQIFDFAGVI